MLNLIFDLDETLIHGITLIDKNNIYNLKDLRFFNINYKFLIKNNRTKKNIKNGKTKKKQKNRKIYKKYNHLIFERKNLIIFLKFCFKYFNVGFWTNGHFKYGKEIIKNILSPEEINKCFCLISRIKMDKNYMYYRDEVTKRKFKIKKTNNNYSKKLEFIYNKKITSQNTILFDDGLYNKATNCKNTILIPKFKYNIKNDQILFKLINYLDKIKKNKKIGNLKFIQDKLFENYKINDNYSIKKSKYEEGDIISSELIYNSALILKVNKKNYKVMYINNKTNQLENKYIKHKDIEFKFKFDM